MLRIIFLRGAQTVTVVLIHRRKLTKPAFPCQHKDAGKQIHHTGVKRPTLTARRKKKRQKHGAVVFTIRHQKLQIKEVSCMKDAAEWSHGKEGTND